MNTIKAVINGRRLELDVPDDWPDGTEVEIHPLSVQADDDAMSPEEIAKLLAMIDQLEPLDLTEAERLAWEAERQARKDWEKAEFAKHAAKLQRMWE
ncbi:MAG: hypothetical protein HY000_35520 [Planctomycetes bacterium]|nr:hypothetical protein [Planctomycetota bacterium]